MKNGRAVSNKSCYIYTCCPLIQLDYLQAHWINCFKLAEKLVLIRILMIYLIGNLAEETLTIYDYSPNSLVYLHTIKLVMVNFGNLQI